MKRFGFFPALAVAAALGIVAALTLFMTGVWLSLPTAVRISLTVVGGAFVILAALRARRGGGRIVLPACWLLASALGWMFLPGLLAYAALQAIAITLTRGLFFSGGVLMRLVEFAACALGLAAALAVIERTHSLPFGVWTFLFVTALPELIPEWSSIDRLAAPDDAAARFDKATKQADAALARLRLNA